MSLQIPVSTDWTFSVVSPLLSPAPTCPSLPDNVPEFQRVTISGDYCAGVRHHKCVVVLIGFNVVAFPLLE